MKWGDGARVEQVEQGGIKLGDGARVDQVEQGGGGG